MEDLKVGDVVQVDDGPYMTIELYTTIGAGCVWFVAGSLHRDTFNPGILKKIR